VDSKLEDLPAEGQPPSMRVLPQDPPPSTAV
jgi:hypothetical protein